MGCTGQVSVLEIKGKFEQLQDGQRTKNENFKPKIFDRRGNFNDCSKLTNFGNGQNVPRIRSQSVGRWSDNKKYQRIGNFENPSNFTSCNEKRKLVDEIVNNIKNLSNDNNNNVNEQYLDKFSNNLAKNNSFTSKLEKDLKNNLERVSRINTHNYRTTEKLKTIESRKPILSQTIKPQIPPKSPQLFAKIRRRNHSIERLKYRRNSIEVSIPQDIESKINVLRNNRKSVFNSGSEPQENLVSNTSSDNLASSLVGNLPTQIDSKTLGKPLIPIRPPRRLKCNEASFLRHSANYENVLFHKRMKSNDVLARSNTDTSERKSYYENIEPQHVNISVPSSPNIAEKNENLKGNSNEIKDKTKLRKVLSCDLPKTLRPNELPPKKPPRTFAHDIYRSLKVENRTHKSHKELYSSTPKLNSEDLNNAFTKPINRIDKKPDIPSILPPLKCQNTSNFQFSNLKLRQIVAPKTSADITERAKQRLSVVEPLPSSTESPSQVRHRNLVKRNSSLRLSLTKPVIKNSRVLSKKESPIRKKMKIFSQVFSMKKEANKDENKKDRLKEGDVSPYATLGLKTNMKSQDEKDNQKELHYMCSNLFEINNKFEKGISSNSRIFLPMNPKYVENDEYKESTKIFDNFKSDFRKSCRNLRFGKFMK